MILPVRPRLCRLLRLCILPTVLLLSVRIHGRLLRLLRGLLRLCGGHPVLRLAVLVHAGLLLSRHSRLDRLAELIDA